MGEYHGSDPVGSETFAGPSYDPTPHRNFFSDESGSAATRGCTLLHSVVAQGCRCSRLLFFFTRDSDEVENLKKLEKFDLKNSPSSPFSPEGLRLGRASKMTKTSSKVSLLLISAEQTNEAGGRFSLDAGHFKITGFVSRALYPCRG
jgi:hypothetical protein